MLNLRQARGPATWSSFPEGSRLADRLVQIAMELPPEPPESLYDSFKKLVRGGEGPSEGGATSGAPSAGESAIATKAGETPAVQAEGEVSGLGTVIQGLRERVEPGGTIDRGA